MEEIKHIISYDLARGLHIIAVIAWISGLLMLPRFYAYQTGSQPGGELETKMIAASRSLRFIIINPSMIATWLLGVFLFAAYLVGDWDRPLPDVLAGVPHWFWLKLLLVLGLSAYHGFLISQGRKLAKGERKHSEKFWRRMSEAPFLIAIVVVLLATVEPF
jgi:putative membrane protein